MSYFSIGKTNGISGELILDSENFVNSKLGKITVDVEQLTSDSNLCDERIRKSFLESSEYPKATFIPEKLIGLPERLEPNQTYSFEIEGYLTVKEATVKTTWVATLSVQTVVLFSGAAVLVWQLRKRPSTHQ